MRSAPQFELAFEFEYGVMAEVAPGVRRLVANNPGPMTFKGTNTYVIGQGEVAIIDPGPDDEAHCAALLRELARGGERVSHILLTHGHVDHSAAMDALESLTGAVTCGYGPTETRAQAGSRAIGKDYHPQLRLRSGDRIRVGRWEIEAVHTPGHAPDHLCYALPAQRLLFSGDHVMGWNTTVIAPPEGRMADYLASLEMLLQREDEIYFPAHGGGVRQPQRLVRAYLIHRRLREAEIVACLRRGHHTIAEIVPRIYEGLESARLSAAAVSVLAHLELLRETGRVHCLEPPAASPLEARYCLCAQSC